jgi:hypothetical protein
MTREDSSTDFKSSLLHLSFRLSHVLLKFYYIVLLSVFWY